MNMSTRRTNEHIPKLLRAIAGGADAKKQKHDIIFNAAADEIDRLHASLARTLNNKAELLAVLKDAEEFFVGNEVWQGCRVHEQIRATIAAATDPTEET